MGILVLSRKPGEQILVGNNIRIEVVSIKGGKAKFILEAPPEIKIDRLEVRQAKEAGRSKPPARTRGDVYRARRQNPHTGCCNRYANQMACDCVQKAPPCQFCNDTGTVLGGEPCPNECPRKFRR